MAQYIKEKIKLLKDFGIKLNKKQLAHLNSLTSEIQVDNYAHDLIFGKGESPYALSGLNNQSKYLGSKRAIGAQEDNMRPIFYMNKSTGEITFDHDEAVAWYSSGVNVGIMNGRNNKEICEWFH